MLGLAPTILKSLSALGYKEPTPIQEQAIPLIMEGHDIMGLAQTGTGKTAAFGLPLIQQLMGIGSKPHPKTIRALILAPTRELANQIADNLKSFLKNTHLRVATVVGGQSINVQQRTLGKGNDILVATPGRLLDLVDRKAVQLNSATFLVLDEADQMLDLGFIHALKKISKMVAKNRQTLLFSATMPKEIEELAKAFLTNPVRVQVAPPGKAADKVSQTVHHVSRREKPSTLRAMLAKNPDDLSLVFARTKHGAEKLMKGLVEQGFPAGSIHGNKSQGQRDRAIRAFKSGEIRILVATDVAARGIDISGVSHVYNYDLPEVPANYVHRIGRTARAGAEGLAVAFCAPDELHLLRAIEKEMKIKIPVVGETFSKDEERQGAAEAKEAKKTAGRGRGGNPGPRRGTSVGEGKRSESRAPSGPKHKKKFAQSEQREDTVAADSTARDDYAVVKAAGFTGKPNSKKNRKRFGPREDDRAEGMAQRPTNPQEGREGSDRKERTKNKRPGNRHSPDFRGKADGDKGESKRGESKKFSKPEGKRRVETAERAASGTSATARPTGGKSAFAKHKAGKQGGKPAEGTAQQNGEKRHRSPNGKKPGGASAHGSGGWQGRKRSVERA